MNTQAFLPSDTQPTSPVNPAARARHKRAPFLRPLLWGGIVGALLSLFGLLWIVQAAQTTALTLVIDGEASAITTRADTVDAMLIERQIGLDNADAITPARDSAITPDMIVSVRQARAIALEINGERRTVYTASTPALEILERAGIVLSENDRLWIDDIPVDAAARANWNAIIHHITVRQSITFSFQEGANTRLIETTAPTLGDALFEAGVALYLSDEISSPLHVPVTPGMSVTLRRAIPITLVMDGERAETRVLGATVGDALSAAGVALVGLDYVVPSEAAPLRENMTLHIFRVRETWATEEIQLPFETVYQADPNAELDSETVIQGGQEGIERTTARVRSENGIEISREIVGTTLVRPAQDRILGYGTNVVIRTVETPEGTREYWRTFRVYATSYHPAALGGDDVTATGRRLQRGIVGADPDLLPYGSEIYVEGYGTGIIADTGGPRDTTRWIDLGYSDSDWINWHRTVTLYWLTPVPDGIDYNPPG